MTSKWQVTRLLHGVRAIIGGRGPPVVLVPGWPQTAEAYENLFEPLSKQYTFIALDPPGLGESLPPAENGYDTANVSRILSEAITDKLGSEKAYHLVGHDVGGWIAYPWAAQFQPRLKSLSILDASVPGFLPDFKFPLDRATNLRLWQFSFHALPDLPEILTTGRERELLTWFFNLKTAKPDGIHMAQFERYIQAYSRPGAMSRGFEYYRAFETSAKQNLQFAKMPLDLPVLALGGASSVGEGMVQLVRGFARNVEGGAIADCGHFLPEEQPSAVAQRLLEFWGKNETEK
ncbi:alpha/beta-hydrolase [Aspergillus carlsbadensis]|nr:alpha/beta-hydrolase [Aspergillus carlsbadensis]